MNYGIGAGNLTDMDRVRKVTLEVPEELLRRAQETTGEGVTATVRKGLELLAASAAYAGLRKWRGKVRFSVDLTELRKDR